MLFFLLVCQLHLLYGEKGFRVHYMTSKFNAKTSAQPLHCSTGLGPTTFYPRPLYWGGVNNIRQRLCAWLDTTKGAVVEKYVLINWVSQPFKRIFVRAALSESQSNISEIYKRTQILKKPSHLSSNSTLTSCICISNITTLKLTDKS